MIKVSIIMPVYNEGDYLKDAIESVYNQTLSGIELICINDGSTDNSLEILNYFSEKYEFIKIFSQPNKGAGSARNKGLDNAIGEYIAFLDADDFYIDRKALEVMYDIAKSNNSNMVSANLISVSQSRKILNTNDNCKEKYYCFDEFCEILPDEYGIPWSFYKNIFKREIIETNDIRFPDLLRGQDPVFLAEILSKVDKIHGVPIKYYGYMFPLDNLLNTPLKKLHYLTHYKKTFKILEDNDLINNSDKYKKDLINLLEIFLTEKDIEGFEFFLDIFGLENPYLEKYHDDIEKLYVHYLFKKILIEHSQEYFNFVKKEYFKLNLWKNDKITKDDYDKIFLILQNDNYQKFKEEYLELKLKFQLNDIEKLSKDNKNLRKEYNKVKKFNDELLNSRSLKLTKFFKKR